MNQATVSITEAARIMGCGRITAYRMAKGGTMPVVKMGNRPILRVPVNALTQWLDEEARKNMSGKEAA